MLKKTISTFSAAAAALSLVVSSSPAFTQNAAKSNQFWWPERLNLEPLRTHDARSNPYGDNFNYAEAFKGVDITTNVLQFVEISVTFPV